MAASLEQMAYKRLRKDLLHGHIRLGQVVSENAIAKRIGISRTPVRHAMRQLANEGVFVPLSHVGAVVKVPSPREVEEIFALRQLLECEAAVLAARKATPEQARELQHHVRQFRSISIQSCRDDAQASHHEWELHRVRADLQIHWTILRIADNRQLARVVNFTHLQTRTRIGDFQEGITLPQVRQKLLRVCREHSRISLAIRRHDEAAARDAMARHIQGARTSFERLLEAATQHGGPAYSPAVQWLLDQQQDDVFDPLVDELAEPEMAPAGSSEATSGHRAISSLASSIRTPQER